jgi:hypothetical protein
MPVADSPVWPDAALCGRRLLHSDQGADRASRRLLAIGNLHRKDRKGLASVIIYVIAIPLAFGWPKAAYGCYIFVAVMWLLPDRRIEKSA